MGLKFSPFILIAFITLFFSCDPQENDEMPFRPGNNPNVCDVGDLTGVNYKGDFIQCHRVHDVLVSTFPNNNFDFSNSRDNSEGYYYIFDHNYFNVYTKQITYYFDSEMNILSYSWTNDNGTVTEYEYSYENGNIVSIILGNAVGNTIWNVVKDENGNVTELLNPDGRQYTFEYFQDIPNPFYKTSCLVFQDLTEVLSQLVNPNMTSRGYYFDPIRDEEGERQLLWDIEYEIDQLGRPSVAHILLHGRLYLNANLTAEFSYLCD